MNENDWKIWNEWLLSITTTVNSLVTGRHATRSKAKEVLRSTFLAAEQAIEQKKAQVQIAQRCWSKRKRTALMVHHWSTVC